MPGKSPRRRPPRLLPGGGLLALAVAILGAAAAVMAQAPYQGVVPGSGQEPPKPGSARRSGVTVTWPGFQMLPDGRSRFFLQSTGPVTHELQPEGNRVVLLLRGVRTHLRNTRRPLVTRYFDTPVLEARLRRRGRDLAFVFELRGGAAVRPSVTTQGGGGTPYQYLYVDFPAGNWLPEEDRPPVRPAAVSPEEQAELDAMDDEPPPDLGEVGEAGR